MKILKPAVAGTLESSDCQVTVEPGGGKIELQLKVLSFTNMANKSAIQLWKH